MNIHQIKKDFESLKLRNYRRVWEPFLKKYSCDFVCELGVYKGDHFEEMIKHNPKLAVAVDAWKDSGVHPRKYDDYTQKEFDEQYQFFKDRVADKRFVRIVRADTRKAASLFLDNFFDFVYIDADHTFEACYSDIITWYPKVKPGKFLVGHDYRRGFGVPAAVDKFIEENNLELIFLPPSIWAVVKNK